jgi:hypothetical protein
MKQIYVPEAEFLDVMGQKSKLLLAIHSHLYSTKGFFSRSFKATLPGGGGGGGGG